MRQSGERSRERVQQRECRSRERKCAAERAASSCIYRTAPHAGTPIYINLLVDDFTVTIASRRRLVVHGLKKVSERVFFQAVGNLLGSALGRERSQVGRVIMRAQSAAGSLGAQGRAKGCRDAVGGRGWHGAQLQH